MAELAPRDHNSPPDPIEDICATYETEREEAANWLDGEPVTSEAQMRSVDALRKSMREWRLALEAGQKSEAAPLHDAWKACLARWKPTIEDAQRIEKGLVAAVDDFKRKLAAEKADAERKARAEADEKARLAREASMKAAASDLEAQRAAAQMQADAEEAHIAAAKASKDAGSVKGLRTVTETVVVDQVALARYLWANDREAQVEFQAERARKMGLNIPGVVEQRKSKVAF